MGCYYIMLTETFWMAFTTSVIGCIMGILRMIYKSKCKKCSICGFVIERDIDAEEQIDMMNIQKKEITNNENDSNK